MRSKHTLSALLASALLFAGAGSALAASVQIVLPEETVPGGSRAQLTVTTDVPGFLTLTLDGPSGSITLCENQEVHTADNTLIFTVSDEDGAPLDVGAYTVNGELIDQFGQTAASLSGQLTVGVPTAQMADEADSDEVPADEAPADTEQSAQPAAQPAAAKPAAAQTSAGSDVEYVASTATVMGDEGYEIGVGVSDTAAQEDSGYWGLTADSSDAEIWAALTRTMVSVDVKETESAYIYNSTSKGKKLGSVSGLSQGLNLIEDLDNGWSLVEAYRNEDGAFVRGYIRTKTLRTVEPNTLYGIVVDKAAQTLTVYKNGERLGSCAVSTVWRPRNTCTAKRPPANTSPSPAAAPSKTRAVTANTPSASAAITTCAKSRPPRKTARISPSWKTRSAQRLPAETSVWRMMRPPTAASTPSGSGTSQRKTKRSRCSSSTIKIALWSPPEVNNFPLLLHKRHNGRGFEPRPLLFILSIYCLCST